MWRELIAAGVAVEFPSSTAIDARRESDAVSSFVNVVDEEYRARVEPL